MASSIQTPVGSKLESLLLGGSGILGWSRRERSWSSRSRLELCSVTRWEDRQLLVWGHSASPLFLQAWFGNRGQAEPQEQSRRKKGVEHPRCTEGRSAEQGGRAGLTEAPEDFFPERMAKVGPSLFSEAWRATAWVFRDRVKAQHHC